MSRYAVYLWNKVEKRYLPFRWLDPFTGAKCCNFSMSFDVAKRCQLGLLSLHAVYIPIIVQICEA